jgi:hypothetical protein
MFGTKIPSSALHFHQLNQQKPAGQPMPVILINSILLKINFSRISAIICAVPLAVPADCLFKKSNATIT